MKEIKLTKGFVVLVDDEDYETLMKHKWGIISNQYSLVKTGKKEAKIRIYAARGIKRNKKYFKILMHRFLLNPPKDKMVDHINGNTLDNRKENLRIADRTKNLRNSKLRSDSKCKYKGVHKKIEKNNKIHYSARIQISTKKRLFLGYFETEIEAAKAYNEAAIKYFGEFAKLNEF